MVSNILFIFHFIYGIICPSHWRTPSCFKMGTLHHQAVILEHVGTTVENQSTWTPGASWHWKDSWCRKTKDFPTSWHQRHGSAWYANVPEIPFLVLKYLSEEIMYIYVYITVLHMSMILGYTYIYIYSIYVVCFLESCVQLYPMLCWCLSHLEPLGVGQVWEPLSRIPPDGVDMPCPMMIFLFSDFPSNNCIIFWGAFNF